MNVSGGGLDRAQQTGAATGTGPSARAGARTTPRGDAVQLSELADRLLTLAKGESPRQTEHIRQLRTDYETGRYKVDAFRVGHSIVQNSLQHP
jgi:anti-sigma28 factor (negative regulator of flagellin synthesis)